MNCHWSIPEKLIIVESVINTIYVNDEQEINKAYIVFGDNTKSLENARMWAGKDAIEKTISGTTEFTFEILECAGRSSQGGKLSFWNCRIRNIDENIDVSVGINSEILCWLLQESTFVKGVCQGNVILSKYDGQLGVVCKGTESYNEAIQSQNNKDNLKIGKTTKWEKGFEYRTQNTADIWVGDAYKPLTIEDDYFKHKYTYDLRNLGKKFHVLIESVYVENGRASYWMWKHNTKFVKSFPSRQKNDAVYYSNTILEKLIVDCINISVDTALSGHDYENNPENCLISVNGKITDDMVNNFKIAFYKLVNYYNLFELKYKHIVICEDGEHEFKDVNSTYDFIEQKLNEFRNVN